MNGIVVGLSKRNEVAGAMGVVANSFLGLSCMGEGAVGGFPLLQVGSALPEVHSGAFSGP